jgi:hypothetical protein
MQLSGAPAPLAPPASDDRMPPTLQGAFYYLEKTMTDTWTPCPDCDEWWCHLHEMHVHDCPCPPLEDLLPIDPYTWPPASIKQRIEDIKKDPE